MTAADCVISPFVIVRCGCLGGLRDQLCDVIVLWILDGDNIEMRACATQGLRKREGVREERE